MSESIVGKVAAVIDDTTLVLNVGAREGVREGMVFAIAAEQQEITDPDSGESLGQWELVKARVSVSHVQERMCTVRSPQVDEGDEPGTLSAMMVQHSLGHYGPEKAHRRLEVRAADRSGRPQQEPIGVGDRARQVEAESESAPPASEGAEDDAAQS